MARQKKAPRPYNNPFESWGVVILSTAQCTVTAKTDMFGLIPGKQYVCLRKCFTRTHNRIFEIVNEDGELKHFGDIWFEPIED